MIKCDFCSRYNASTRRCMGDTGGYACAEAAKRFLQFMKSSRTRTKNVNVHKTTKKYNNYKKR